MVKKGRGTNRLDLKNFILMTVKEQWMALGKESWGEGRNVLMLGGT